MTLHIEIPDAIAREARDLAAREHITVDSLIAAALTAQPSPSVPPEWTGKKWTPS